MKAGLKPLRVGFGSRIRPSLRDYSLDYLLTKHPLQPLCVEALANLERLEIEIDQLSVRLSDTLKKLEKGSKNKALSQRAENMYKMMAMKDRQQTQLKGKVYGLQQEMLHDIVKSADVVSDSFICRIRFFLQALPCIEDLILFIFGLGLHDVYHFCEYCIERLRFPGCVC